MKTLKKTLSLVLVLCMVLSLCAFGTGADYKDADKITYTEAVEVMTNLGVIDGMDDGNFNPTGTFTREQAAKILAYMLLGPKNADAFSTYRAPFTDVAADRWSAGYIAYCASEGIIGGYGDGRFGPEDALTSYQWAKMLLVALGFDAEIEQLVGADWQVNTTKLAISSKLLDNSDLVGIFNREMAVKYAFQCLTTTMVNYSNRGTVVETSDGTKVTVGASEPYKMGNSTAKDYRTVTADKDEYLQFCEQYFNKLTLNANDYDDFGRPGNKWTNDKKKVGFYADEPEAVYTAEVKASTIYSDLGLSETTDMEVFHDGYTDDDMVAEITKTGKAIEVDGVKPSGNGILTEVYKIGDEYRIVMVTTYVAKVTKVTAAKGDKEAYATLNVLGTTETVKYETEDLAKNDYVIFNYSFDASTPNADYDEGVQNVKVVTPEEQLKVTKITAGKSFVADGTTYNFNKYYVTDGKAPAVKGEADVYLDDYGYAIYVKEYSAAEKNYAFVKDVNNSGFDGVAKIVTAAGTQATVDTDEKYSLTGQMVETSVDDDGVYEFKALPTSGDVYQDWGTGAVAIKKNDVNFTLGGTPFAANNSTIFVVEKSNGKSYNVYTGYKNVPDVTGGSDTTYAVVVDEGIASFVYISNKAETSDSENNVLIIGFTKEKSVVTDNDNNEYVLVDAIIDGAIVENIALSTSSNGVTVVGSGDDAVATVVTNIYKSASTKAGYEETIYTVKSTNIVAPGVSEGSVAVKNEDGVLTIAGPAYNLDSKIVAFVIDSEGDAVELDLADDFTYEAADIASVMGVKNAAGTKLTELYIFTK